MASNNETFDQLFTNVNELVLKYFAKSKEFDAQDYIIAKIKAKAGIKSGETTKPCGIIPFIKQLAAMNNALNVSDVTSSTDGPFDYLLRRIKFDVTINFNVDFAYRIFIETPKNNSLETKTCKLFHLARS